MSRIGLLAGILAGTAGQASAQSETQVIRGDVAATIAWLAADTHPTGPYNDNNWASSFFGAASAGWHWTDNLKTEVDFGAGTKARVFSTEPITIDGRATYVTTDSRFSRRTLGISQQYQFFHNVWFHPHLGAGANFTLEHSTYHRAAVSVYDPVSRTSRLVSPERNEPSRTDFHVSPFVEAGFKAYMTPRTFFRSDLRVAFRHRVDDVVTRFGFGFDF